MSTGEAIFAVVASFGYPLLVWFLGEWFKDRLEYRGLEQ